MSSAPSSLPAADEPLHGCVRCGARIPLDQAMCEGCNPLGLKQPATSQAHGTVFLGIGVAVVALAVLARLAVAGVGPFPSSVASVAPDPAGLRISITLTNEGENAGSTTCRVGDPEIRGIGPETAYIASPVVQPGETLTFDAVVTTFGTEVKPLTAVCDT